MIYAAIRPMAAAFQGRDGRRTRAPEKGLNSHGKHGTMDTQDHLWQGRCVRLEKAVDEPFSKATPGQYGPWFFGKGFFVPMEPSIP